MIVIIDTSILISTLLSRGKTHLTDVIRLAKSKQLTLAISPQTLAEFKQAIQSDKVKQFIAYDPRIFASFVAWYQYNTRLYSTSNYEMKTVLRDYNDNIFLMLAHACKADYLISGDKDLLIIKKIGTTHIVNPEKFIREYTKKHSM